MWRCDNCIYWKKIDKEQYKAIGKEMGECRFNAPNMIFYRKNELEPLDKYPIFPLMGCDDQCGQFKLIVHNENISFWDMIIGILKGK